MFSIETVPIAVLFAFRAEDRYEGLQWYAAEQWASEHPEDPDVEKVLEVLGPDVSAILFYGASVFGQPVFDVDLHVLLRRQLTVYEWNQVTQVHEHLARMGQFNLDELDFWYILLSDARGTANPRHLAPWANGLVDEHWALHRAHWLAGRCHVVYGFEPSAIVQPPTWEQLDRTLRRELQHPEPSAYWASSYVVFG